MNVRDPGLSGVLLLEPRAFDDARGRFFEAWHRERYREAGIPQDFVQDNVSFSRGGVLRGLHYQHPHEQGKLVYTPLGEIFDVAVDIRVGSPSFGRWVGCTLTAENCRQLYIPPGFAHGFVVLSESAVVSYKCTERYVPAAEGTILWNDPGLDIEWPVREPILSDKDRAGALLRELDPGSLPVYEPAGR